MIDGQVILYGVILVSLIYMIQILNIIFMLMQQVLQQPLDYEAFEKQVCDDLDPANTTARDHTNFLMVTNLSHQLIICYHHN